MSKEEVKEILPFQRADALNYCWTTYAMRAVNLPDKRGGKGPTTISMTWDQSVIEQYARDREIREPFKILKTMG